MSEPIGFPYQAISLQRGPGGEALFLQLAAAEPGRFRVIDGAREPELVARDVHRALEARFALDLGGAG